jgi:hypothetical protein
MTSAKRFFLSVLAVVSLALIGMPVALAAPGDLTLASTSDAGIKGNNLSQGLFISADGTKVAFWSFANNFDPDDTDQVADIYVKDLATGDITLASTSDTGIKGNNDSIGASLSADGTKVAFYSNATNLDPADSDGAFDVYVKDLSTGDLTSPLLRTVGPRETTSATCRSYRATARTWCSSRRPPISIRQTRTPLPTST